MAEPWLTIIGIGEDGLEGLAPQAHALLAEAAIIFGGPRHLALAGAGERGRTWPVPFSVAPVLACRPHPTVVLASGDPFWFGAGGSLAAHLAPDEWHALPAPSSFALAAARLGWRLEETICLGLHAAPLARLRPHLARGTRLICLLRGPEAVTELAAWLTAQGFGLSRLWRLEALGGPRERITEGGAQGWSAAAGIAPVAVAVELAGGLGLPRAPGLPDELFEHDGQITKRAIRALTLSALAPRAGECLWDIGTGSGSVAVEWLLAAPASRACGLEADAARAARALRNAASFGVEHRFSLTQARAPEGLEALPRPDAVFIGGGASAALLERLWALAPPGTRLVANAVTLETEALFIHWAAAKGGSLLRLELAEAKPLGRLHGWEAARPIVQWSVVL
ncbi:MAG: precorrin-6y C5,15-methyltransferase (decarboxylating) subunit CbiE [Acidocella sp.]|nr:precorrin-6y C5,15-methyltransferase (decarboxylating) subunit CbiE [Acidocella sp.]